MTAPPEQIADGMKTLFATPRTDALQQDFSNPAGADVWTLARTLERELAAAQADNARLRKDAERLDWILRDYRGIDLYNALEGRIRVCDSDLTRIRIAIDEMIAKDVGSSAAPEGQS